MMLNFKQYLEDVFGSGLPIPIQQPIDPEPGKGQTDAFPRICMKGSKELPPTPKIIKTVIKFRKKTI